MTPTVSSIVIITTSVILAKGIIGAIEILWEAFWGWVRG